MPKMKSNRGAKKRFKKTAKGKVKRHSAYAAHKLSGKTAEQKRRLRKSKIVDKADEKRVKRMLAN
ncbi:MAG: 50S ribosomal protein L35 [Candidatus Marinimicrobia bacterium]|nr:50S ribosomal protein L35 [Candidatus Neomarinimicrobiota bacterium]MCF7828270.1 50S ribosomal protein L35 [Candidatus Neomarinimicrobiota bacterium]MCF7879555.1 50S ribosomal protein L35 [Candidatus Neomarinimicrobiota bacterium]